LLPRERVETALSFRTPDKIPLQVHPSPAGLYEHGQKLLDLMRACGGDFCDHALTTLPDPPLPQDFDLDGRYHAVRTDAWGTTWEYRIFGVWGHPIEWPLNDLAALDTWRAPEAPPLRGPQWDAARSAADTHRRTWFLVEDIGSLLETLRWVRRFELILMDIQDDTPQINRIADIIAAYDAELVRRALSIGSDAVQLGDDLGTSSALMFAPETFRRFLKPRYSALFKPALDARTRVFFHSCGMTMPVLKDLADVGVSALWPQLPLYDHADLARRCRDLGLALLLHPDRGELMQRGTPGQVREYVLRLLDTFDTAHGGSWLYIEIDPGFPWENVQALFSVAMEARR